MAFVFKKYSFASGGAVEDLDAELSEQEALIGELKEKLANGGSGGGSGVIDVTELPTENIDEGAVYRLTEEKTGGAEVYISHPAFGVITYEELGAMQGSTVSTPTYVVESLPEVMEPVNIDPYIIPYYIIESTGIVYVSQDGTSSSAVPFGSMVGKIADKGWVDSVDGLDPTNNEDDIGVYCVRGEDRTAISYGVPGNADLRSIKEYTTDDGWKTIINRVDAFPTENIEDEAVYQIRKEVDELLDVWLVLGEQFSGNFVDMGRQEGVQITATYYLVDELPESPIVSTASSSGANIHVYIIRDTGEPFVLMKAGGVCGPLGETMFNGLSFNGIISDSADATSDGVYTIMREAGVEVSYAIPKANGRNKVYEQTADGTWERVETAKLKAENEALATEKATLEAENETLTNENETLTNENETLTNENETLTNEKTALEAENETLTAEKVALEAEVDSMALYAIRGKAAEAGDAGSLNFARYATLSKTDTGIAVTGMTNKNIASVTIPEGVTSIGYQAFGYFYSLTSVTIPDSVTSIADMAFVTCKSLTSITIPNSVTSIGKYAFQYCTSLTSITIPNSVTSIGNGAFSDNDKMQYYDFTGYAAVPTIGSIAFANIPSTCEIRVPAALYDEWVAATNWSTYASNIVAVETTA